ncbi:MAG: hypothetical protein JWO62_252 [Acidimicrobiaceae bacterium]|jgi:hypothetical protein|nr:hypothetical protein [Acidimicrobiaceae bacterium]
MSTLHRMRGRDKLAAAALCAGSIVGCSVLFASTALASPAILTRGHAYCFYFWGHTFTGGMHLVAGGPRVITAGPSNYISGTGGKPQDTVVYVDCLTAAGRADGDAYVGLPRFVLGYSNGHYAFAEHVVVSHVKRLGSTDARTVTVSVSISGTVTTGSSATGAIKGTLRVTAPACLPKPLNMQFTGT